MKSDLKTNPPAVLHLLEATLGGTMRYVINIIDAAAQTGAGRTALAYSGLRGDPSLGEALQKARAVGWELFELPMQRAIHPVQDLRSVLRLRQILNRFQPDILHCHSSKAGAVGRVAARSVTKPIRTLYSPHALAVSLGAHYLFAERGLAPLTDAFVAVSECEKQEILRYGLATSNQVHVIHPTVNTSYFKPVSRQETRRALGLPEAPLLIGVGRLTKQKDPLAFVGIAARLRLVVPALQAIWVGDGELRSAVESASTAAGLTGTLQITGWQTDVRTYLAAADVLLSTSRYESFGYMVAEALAMKCPVVATAVSGTRDILQGRFSNYLYEAGAAEQGLAALQAILSQPGLASELGQAGRAMVTSRFSRDRMSRSLTQCYRTVYSGAFHNRAIHSDANHRETLQQDTGA